MTLIERYCKRVRGGDYKLVEQELLKITPGKKASLQRSIRLHKGLPPEVLQYLRSWPRLPAAMVIDNHYLMGTGGHAKERLSPPWAIAALDILKDEPVKADEFKNRICRCMRKARGAPRILKFMSFAFTEVEFHHPMCHSHIFLRPFAACRRQKPGSQPCKRSLVRLRMTLRFSSASPSN